MQFYLLKTKLNKILHFFAPPRCFICKKEEAKICNSCIDLLIPSNVSIIDGVEVFSCFEYSPEIANILIDLKYNGKAEICSMIGDFMIKFYKNEIKEGDFLLPIPINFLTQIKRGYNIPNLICLKLKSHLNIRILNLLQKKLSKSQVGLKKSERLKNAKNFFAIHKKNGDNIKGKTVILIDDVFTTGSTIKSAIYEVKKFNPVKIKVFTFAKKSLM